MSPTTRLALPHELTSASAARRQLAFALRSAGIAPDRCDDAALVLSELIGNALRHGRPRPDGSITVRWRLTEHRLHLEVSDGGGAGKPTMRRAPDGAVASSGRGLAIVDAVTDDWGARYDADGTTVWAVLAAPAGTMWDQDDYEQTG